MPTASQITHNVVIMKGYQHQDIWYVQHMISCWAKRAEKWTLPTKETIFILNVFEYHYYDHPQ